MAILPLPALPLPGYWLLAHAVLFLVAAALTVGAALVGIVVGQGVAWGVRKELNYWRG